jgi:hypothetical protein
MPNSKQQRKHELLPITYDELLSNSSMTGLISFLEVPPHSAVEAESAGKSSGAPKLGAPELATGDTLFTLDSMDIVYRPSAEVREMRQGQDGHTIGEQRLYEALWRLRVCQEITRTS